MIEKFVKVVSPAKAGVQEVLNGVKILDSGFRSTSFGGLLMEVGETDRPE
jgi:hypothetical protein